MDQITDGNGAWLRELEEQLHAGDPWGEAIGRYWERIAGRPPPTWPPRSGAVNWHWLTDLEELDRVVDLGSPFGDLALHFEREGAVVDYWAGRSAHLDVVRARMGQASSRVRVVSGRWFDPKDMGLADLVVLLASDGWGSRVPSVVAEHTPRIDQTIRLLRPGGWFAALLPNLLSFEVIRKGVLGIGHAEVGKLARIQRLRSAIEGAAFRELRFYLLLPGIGRPEVMVPRTRHALDAHRSGGQAGPGYLSRIVGRLYPLRFPGVLVLGKR